MMQAVARTTAWLGVLGAILAAWAAMYLMATGMGVDLLGRPDAAAAAMAAMDPRMDMPMPMAGFGPLFGMWAAMMAAMMLPVMVPTLATYEDLIRSADGSRAGWFGVLLGYFLAWVAFAALIAAVQMALLYGGAIDMLGRAGTWLSAGLLIAVGLYQFTRLKAVCHGVCHAPMGYFLGRWRPGFGGGLRMGLGLGAFCVGCCWGYMALGFVGGVMSLAWMGLATFVMILEKLRPIGHALLKPVGAALVAAGLALAAGLI